MTRRAERASEQNPIMLSGTVSEAPIVLREGRSKDEGSKRGRSKRKEREGEIEKE
jgi:hypothetical protein